MSQNVPIVDRGIPNVTAGTPANAGGSSVLLLSLQRLCDLNQGQLPPPPAASGATGFPAGDVDIDLSASLLEAMFEISDFDPLPQLNSLEDDFVTENLSPGQRKNHHRRALPDQAAPHSTVRVPGRTEPQLLVRPGPTTSSESDRRKLPRRESECIVSVCPCSGDERLTAERTAWLLHATRIKGTLVDVSMSGISFRLQEPLAPDTKILLRIKNRTIDEHVDTVATVLRARKSSDGGWNIVCRFQRNLTFEQIHVVGRSLFAATIV